MLSNLAKVSRLEKVLQKEKQPQFEEVKAKARNLVGDGNVTGSDEIAAAGKDLEDTWESLNRNIDLVKSQAEISNQLLQGLLQFSL